MNTHDILAKARATSGRFARHGSASHYAAHIATYRDQKATGEIAGTQDDYAAHRAAWTTEKVNETNRLHIELRHCEADQRAGEKGLEGKITELRGKLRKRGRKV